MGKTARWLKALFGLKTSTKINGSRKLINLQAKHAITVAVAATAVAANAAVAAAQAAAEVVRINMLTTKGRNSLRTRQGGRWAAIRIQTNFRGYLARKALRALKGIVKIQAIVRGYLVRKRADATLRAMQAILGLQSKRAVYGLHIDLGRAMTLHWARSSMGGFGGTIETEQYYNSRRSRRLSLSSLEAEALNPPKAIEVGDRRSGSRSSMGRLEPYHHCLKECRPANVWTTSSSKHEGCGKEEHLLYSFYHHPNYMSETMSFKAKTRAHSAPKQRPEAPLSDGKRWSVSSGKKRMTLSGVLMETTNRRNTQGISHMNLEV